MGSTSTTVTANWTVVADASGSPTVVSGDDVEVFVNNTTHPFTGEAWSDIDLMDPIPAGATITDVTFSLTAQADGSREAPDTPISPQLEFYDKSQYLDGTFTVGFGRFGAGGVGDLPDDNDPHSITYDNNTYEAVGGAGISDVVAFAAALSDASTPVIIRALGPGGGATGTGIWYRAPLTITFLYDEFAPCDTTVDLDLSTATFSEPSGTPMGQYVDGVITGLDGTNAQFWFPFELDPVKKYRVTVTFDPSSPHDGDGNPVTSDRFILLYDTTPGDEDDGVGVEILDAFGNTDDVATLLIGPGVDNGDDFMAWDDPDEGVAQGFTRLLFQTSASGAVSAISIRKLCTFVIPPLRQYPREDGLGASSAPRVYPPPKSIQHSNRRAGGYL